MFCVGIVCHSFTYDNNTHDKDNNSLRLPEAWLITAVAESKSKFTKMTGDFDTYGRAWVTL